MSFPNLKDVPYISIDYETYGVAWGSKLFGAAIAAPTGEAWYYDIRADEGLSNWLQDTVDSARLIVNHHVKFDIHTAEATGIYMDPAKCECTMIRACLIDEHLMEYNLDALAKRYLNMAKDDSIYLKLAALFGGPATRKAQMPNLHRAPKSIVDQYAKTDAIVALRLWEWQEEEIKRQGLERVWDLEKRLFPHIVDMERRGIRVDLDKAAHTNESITSKIQILQRNLDEIAGFKINVNPSQSIKDLFKPELVEVGGTSRWRLIDGTMAPHTEAGQPSINAAVLKVMKHPAAALILETRQLIKMRDTFISGHVISNAINGRVHPNINQTKGERNGEGDSEGTGTGRLSYTAPALQQIPARNKQMAALIRPIFIPDEGQLWSYGDLEQHELRIFIHYAKPPALIAAYRENPDLDLHQAVADLTGLPRSAQASGEPNAKQINLGLVFNMGAGTLAEKMGLPYTVEKMLIGGVEREVKRAGPETLEILDTYYNMMPGVREMSKQARSVAASRGYVKTLFGRHIRFPGGKYTHKASGLIYQASSADLNKDNMSRICDYLKEEGIDGRLLLNIHDEYSVSLPADADHKKILTGIRDRIQDRPELRVPIRINFGVPALNWWDATNTRSIHD